MKQSWLKRTLFDASMGAYFVCLALIAILHPSPTAMLNLPMNCMIFVAATIGSAALSFVFNRLQLKTLGELIFEPAHRKALSPDQAFYRQIWSWQLLLFLIATSVAGAQATQFSFVDLADPDGFAGAIRLFQGLANPAWDLLPKAVLKIIETMFMAFMATILAAPVAFLLCFFCAKNIMRSPIAFTLYMALRSIMNITRSVEALIWAIIFSVWVGIGPFAGMLALWIHSVVSLIKQYSEIVENVNEGPIEGIESTGASKLQIVWFAIVPQVMLPFISFTLDRWDINIRMATIIGLVGGGGIGTLLIQYQGQAMWNEVGTIIVVIAVVVWLMDTASAHLREALR